MLLCTQCSKEGSLRCSGCHESTYCSKTCQEKDWKHHKFLCKAFAKFAVPPPTPKGPPSCVRAIYFHPQHEKPRFIWLEYTSLMPGYMSIDFSGTLGITAEEKTLGYVSAPNWADITYNTNLGRKLPYTIRIDYRDDAITATADAKKAAHNVSSSLSPYRHDWRGPLIAYGIRDFFPDSTAKHGHNLVPSDLCHISSFFDWYLYKKPSDVLHQSMKELKLGTIEAIAIKQPVEYIPCVRINCDGDVENNKRPRFETVHLPSTHAIFNQQPTQVSKRIDLPISAARIPGSIHMWERRGSIVPNSNQAAPYLYLTCDPDASDEGLMAGGYYWGWAPLTWDSPVGSCIVARLDRKPLSAELANAVSNFCQFHLISFSGQQREGDLPRTHLLKEISKDKFDRYFQAWKLNPDKREIVDSTWVGAQF